MSGASGIGPEVAAIRGGGADEVAWASPMACRMGAMLNPAATAAVSTYWSHTDMPKMKTHRGAAKRIKVTGSGQLRRRRAFRNHLLEKKSSARTRRLGRPAEVAAGDQTALKRLLGR